MSNPTRRALWKTIQQYTNISNMPKTYKRKTRRRRYKRKTRGQQISAIQNKIHIFPGTMEKYRTKLVYTERRNILSGTPDLPNHYQYSVNNIFDPNRSGVGHQPKFHDILATLYRQYRVLGSKITVNFIRDSGQVFPMTCFLFRNDDTISTNVNSYELLSQHVGIQKRNLAPSIDRGVMSKKWSLKNTFGWNDDNTQAAFGTSPGEEAFFQVSTINTFPGGTQAAVVIEVKVEYIVECTERQDIPLS